MMLLERKQCSICNSKWKKTAYNGWKKLGGDKRGMEMMRGDIT